VPAAQPPPPLRQALRQALCQASAPATLAGAPLRADFRAIGPDVRIARPLLVIATGIPCFGGSVRSQIR